MHNRDYYILLRNIIAHHYFGINVDIVWEIINDDLPELKSSLNSIIKQ
ncbi:MAG: HepT-like ribonuclease domain-containing protein [Bacteroidota bacterium]